MPLIVVAWVVNLENVEPIRVGQMSIIGKLLMNKHWDHRDVRVVDPVTRAWRPVKTMREAIFSILIRPSPPLS